MCIQRHIFFPPTTTLARRKYMKRKREKKYKTKYAKKNALKKYPRVIWFGRCPNAHTKKKPYPWSAVHSTVTVFQARDENHRAWCLDRARTIEMKHGRSKLNVWPGDNRKGNISKSFVCVWLIVLCFLLSFKTPNEHAIR